MTKWCMGDEYAVWRCVAQKQQEKLVITETYAVVHLLGKHNKKVSQVKHVFKDIYEQKQDRLESLKGILWSDSYDLRCFI